MRPPAQRIPSAERMVRLQLEQRDISDQRVLEAMRCVPRHLFAPAEARHAAYEDHPVPIGRHQTMSQPYMVAFMTQALELRGPERTLEIGTGSGYQAAVLAALCAEVFTVERLQSLADSARTALASLAVDNVRVRAGDGSEGWPEEAPFDVIFVNGAVEINLEALFTQLRDGGRLIALKSVPGDQTGRASKAVRYDKIEGGMGYRALFDASAPVLEAFRRNEQFTFF